MAVQVVRSRKQPQEDISSLVTVDTTVYQTYEQQCITDGVLTSAVATPADSSLIAVETMTFPDAENALKFFVEIVYNPSLQNNVNNAITAQGNVGCTWTYTINMSA